MYGRTPAFYPKSGLYQIYENLLGHASYLVLCIYTKDFAILINYIKSRFFNLLYIYN